MKKKASKWISVVTVFFAIICIVEGFVYYVNTTENLFIMLMMIIKNTFKAFFMSSNIDIKDAAKLMGAEYPFVIRALQYVYSVVIILAPICTAAVFLNMVKNWYYKLLLAIRIKNKPQVSVFGSSAESEILVKNAAKEYCPVWYISEKFDEDKKFAFLEKGIQIVTGVQQNDSDIFEDRHLEKSKYIALMETTPMKSVSIFSQIVAYLAKKTLTENITCVVSSEDISVSELLENYYQSSIADSDNLKQYLDLVIMHPSQLEAMEILQKKPIYNYQLSEYNIEEEAAKTATCSEKKAAAKDAHFWDVHMVIAGLGKLGQQLLLQSLNMGVLHSGATMRFDIYDNKMDERLGRLLKNFAVTASQHVKDHHFVLPFCGSMDGRVDIYFHQVDVFTASLEESLEKISREMPITYAAVCFRDSALAMAAMSAIEKVLPLNNKEHVPLVMHLEADKDICNFLQQDDERYANVWISREKNHILHLDAIKSYVENSYAMEFNYRYNQIDLNNAEKWHDSEAVNPEIVRASWQKMLLVKRNSSRALALHSSVKQLRMAEFAYEKLTEAQKPAFAEFLRELNTNSSYKAYYDSVMKDMEELFTYGETSQFIEALNSNPVIHELAALEHRRWCQYMITAGYSYKDCKKDDVRRTNPCLLSWDDLCEKLPEYCQYDLTAYILL